MIRVCTRRDGPVRTPRARVIQSYLSLSPPSGTRATQHAVYGRSDCHTQRGRRRCGAGARQDRAPSVGVADGDARTAEPVNDANSLNPTHVKQHAEKSQREASEWIQRLCVRITESLFYMRKVRFFVSRPVLLYCISAMSATIKPPRPKDENITRSQTDWGRSWAVDGGQKADRAREDTDSSVHGRGRTKSSSKGCSAQRTVHPAHVTSQYKHWRKSDYKVQPKTHRA